MRSTLRLVAGVILLSVAATSGLSAQAGQAGRIKQIKKIINVQGTYTDSVVKNATDRVQLLRRRPVQASRNSLLQWGDSLLLQAWWRTRLRVNLPSNKQGTLTLLPEILTERGDTVMGPRAGPEGGLYSIRESSAGQPEINLYRGSLIALDWRASRGETIRVHAAGAVARNSGTSWAVNVTDDGVAQLFVEEGEVEISRGDSSVVAGPATLWSWSETAPLVSIPVGAEVFEALRGALHYNGDEIWDDGLPWYPFLIIPAAVVGCFVFDYWPCDDDDPTGTVTISP